jgi:putative peptidoglycan lipid II flippase
MAQSIGLIGATLLAYFTGRVALLAWGFTVPYLVLWAWAAVIVRRAGYLPRRSRTVARLRSEVTHEFWRRLRPLLWVPIALQGCIATERVVSSLLGEEIVAATDYARFVIDSGQALIAVPLGLASLASFSRMPTREAERPLRQLVATTLIFVVPISVILSMEARPLVDAVYRRGHFSAAAAENCSIILSSLAWGFWALVTGYVLVKVLNAQGRNHSVAITVISSSVCTAIIHLSLYNMLGAFVIGAATSAGALVTLMFAAQMLSLLKCIMGLLLKLAPGVAAMWIVGTLCTLGGLPGLILSALLMALTWLGYLLMVPSLRLIVFRRTRATR